MRVTEQIDALETLSYDPVAFLILPRLIAAIVMLPCLVVRADAVGLFSGYLVSVYVTGVTAQDFVAGVRLGFGTFQVVYLRPNAALFGAAIAFGARTRGTSPKRARKAWARARRRRSSSPRGRSSFSIR